MPSGLQHALTFDSDGPRLQKVISWSLLYLEADLPQCMLDRFGDDRMQLSDPKREATVNVLRFSGYDVPALRWRRVGGVNHQEVPTKHRFNERVDVHIGQHSYLHSPKQASTSRVALQNIEAIAA